MALNSLGLGFTFRANDETGPGMASAQGNLGKTKRAAEATALSMKDVGRGFEKVGATAAIAGAALGAGLGLAVAQAAKFQFGVASVATEADAAKLPAAEIANIAKQMAMTYGGDLDTQVKALYQGVAAGADTAAKSIALMNGANRLAIAGQTTQETALLGITKVLNNYNMSFDKATDVADAFFVAVKGGQTTVGELGEAVGQVAALGKNAGVSMEELIGALGTAATLGKDTASSAAAMKAALSGIAHPTAEAAAEAQKLGIKFDSASLRSKGLAGFLKDITTSSKYSADSMNKLFGSVEAAAFMSALASNNMSAFNSMMDGMKNKAGGAEAAFQTMSQTLQQSASILKANVQVALVEIGNVLLPLVTYVVRFVTSMIKGFLSLPDPAKKAITAFAAVTAVVLTVVGAVAGLVGALLTMELPLAAVGVALGAVLAMIGPLVIIGGSLIAVIFGIKRAFDENIGGLKMTVMPLLEKLDLTWRALSQAFSQGGFSGAVRDELNKGNEPIKNFVVGVYSFAMRVKNFFEGIQKGFESASNAAGPTFARLALAFDRLGAALAKVFGGKADPDKAAQSFDKFGSAGERVGATIEKIVEVVVSGFTYAIDFVTGFIDMFHSVSGAFDNVWSSVKVLGSAFGDLFSALGQLVSAFTGTSQSGQTTGEMFATWITVLADVFSVIIRIAAFMIGIFTPAIRGIALVVEFVGAIFKFVFDGIKRDVINILTLITKAVDAVASIGGKDLGLTKSLQGMTGGGTPSGPNKGGASWLAPSPAAPGTNKPGPSDALVEQKVEPVVIAPAPTLASQVTNVPQVGTGPLTSPAVASIQAGANQGGNGGITPDQMEASMGRAMRQAPPPQAGPVVVPVYLDGQKVGEGMANAKNQDAAREFSPQPLPSG